MQNFPDGFCPLARHVVFRPLYFYKMLYIKSCKSRFRKITADNSKTDLDRLETFWSGSLICMIKMDMETIVFSKAGILRVKKGLAGLLRGERAFRNVESMICSYRNSIWMKRSCRQLKRLFMSRMTGSGYLSLKQNDKGMYSPKVLLLLSHDE